MPRAVCSAPTLLAGDCFPTRSLPPVPPVRSPGALVLDTLPRAPHCHVPSTRTHMPAFHVAPQPSPLPTDPVHLRPTEVLRPWLRPPAPSAPARSCLGPLPPTQAERFTAAAHAAGLSEPPPPPPRGKSLWQRLPELDARLLDVVKVGHVDPLPCLLVARAQEVKGRGTRFGARKPGVRVGPCI